jgi:hypothetical protein
VLAAVDLTVEEDEGPTAPPADDEADPPGAVGTEAAPRVAAARITQWALGR